jgi:hypothetical protein
MGSIFCGYMPIRKALPRPRPDPGGKTLKSRRTPLRFGPGAVERWIARGPRFRIDIHLSLSEGRLPVPTEIVPVHRLAPLLGKIVLDEQASKLWVNRVSESRRAIVD